MKNKTVDAILIIALVTLIILEFAVNSNKLSNYQVIMGLVIGFSIGFKISSLHSSTVSREAIELARVKGEKLDFTQTENQQTEQAYQTEIKRKDKLLKTLTANLKDRDEEVMELIQKLNQKNPT